MAHQAWWEERNKARLHALLPVSNVGQDHIYGKYTASLTGESPNIRLYGVRFWPTLPVSNQAFGDSDGWCILLQLMHTTYIAFALYFILHLLQLLHLLLQLLHLLLQLLHTTYIAYFYNYCIYSYNYCTQLILHTPTTIARAHNLYCICITLHLHAASCHAPKSSTIYIIQTDLTRLCVDACFPQLHTKAEAQQPTTLTPDSIFHHYLAESRGLTRFHLCGRTKITSPA